MATKTQKDLDRSARAIANVVLGTGLGLSLVGNALSAVHNPDTPNQYVLAAMSAIAPLALFGTSMLLERLRTDPITKIMLGIVAIAAMAYSWYDLAQVNLYYGTPDVMAWGFPILIDVPMLLAGRVILTLKINSAPTRVRAPQAKKVQPVVARSRKVTTNPITV